MTSDERSSLCQSLIGLILRGKENLLECFKHNLQKEWIETGDSSAPDNLSMATVYETVLEFFKQHSAIPTRKLLLIELAPKKKSHRLVFKNIIDQCKKIATKDTIEMVAPYIEKIAEYYRHAMAISVIKDTVEEDSDGGYKTTQDMANAIISKLVCVQQSQRGMNQIQLAYDAMTETIAGLKSRKYPPIPTGWYDLDEPLEGGWFPGTISTVAGRPGMGKTILLLNGATNTAKMGIPTLFIGAELPTEELNYRQFSLMSDNIPYNKMFRGYDPKDPKCINKKEMREINAVHQVYEGMPLYIVNAMGMDIGTVTNLIIEQVMIHGVRVVFLDYFQRMCIKIKNGAGVRRANTPHEFTDISNKLLLTTVYTKIALVQGSQLNRECEKRKGDERRPRISDLKDSGCIEEDSHRVFGLFRDEFYNPLESQRPGLIDIQFLKNRSGSNPLLEMHFNGKRGMISSIAKG